MRLSSTDQDFFVTSTEGASSSSSPAPLAFESIKKKNPTLPFEMQEAALQTLHLAIDEEKLLIEGLAPPTPLPSPFMALTSISSSSPVQVIPEIADLFEKCVHSMIHMDTAGIAETTFYLDAPQFKGAKIVITEFNTAPKAFNIALVGAPEAIALFNLHAQDLLAAFKNSSFNFSVHRLESDIDLHLIKKIEETSDQEDEENR